MKGNDSTVQGKIKHTRT